MEWPEANPGRSLLDHRLLLTSFRYPSLVDVSRFCGAVAREFTVVSEVVVCLLLGSINGEQQLWVAEQSPPLSEAFAR